MNVTHSLRSSGFSDVTETNALLWYVQCATDVRLEGKTGHGQCCYEGLLALKTAVCGHVYFSFPRKVSG